MARRPPPLAEPRYSGAELAKACGVGRSAITEAKKVGRVTLGPDGKYGPESVDAFHGSRAKTPGPGRNGKKRDASEGPDPEELLRWRIVNEREKALKIRLERQALQGKLVPIDVAESERADTSALIRTRLEGIAPKLADKLAACSSPRECRDMVAEEIRVVLDELADDGEREDSDE